MKSAIKKAFDILIDELWEVSMAIHNAPELGYEEKNACRVLSNTLRVHEFTVTEGVYNIETAFRAEYTSSKMGPTVAFLCEYDALPGIGHACGHNLIAAMGMGAGIGLKTVIDDIGGRIVVLGTPAEETDGAKIAMISAGAFDDIDIAMMTHPGAVSETSGSSMALNAYEFKYFGKSAHAAQSPEQGINALDAVIQLFNGINALRQHVPDDVRIHGIITDGGKAPNIVPDYAAAQFYIRAGSKAVRDMVTKKVLCCADGAAEMTGARLETSVFNQPYDDLVSNQMLSELFNANLLALGEKFINPAKAASVSLDMGNVSQIVPSIHPWIGLDCPGTALHTSEFAAKAASSEAKSALKRGACAMAMTAYDYLDSKDTQVAVRKFFDLK